MSDQLLTAIAAGAPGALALLWQFIKWFQTKDQERQKAEVEIIAEEAGILAPLRAELTAVRTDLSTERGRTNVLEIRVCVLEAQLRSLGYEPIE